MSQTYNIHTMNKKLSIILKENEGKAGLESLIHAYQKVFGLKCSYYTEKVSQEFLSYCQRGKFFIEVVAYNSQREIFIQRDLVRNKNAWELIGGWINSDESFEEALDRVVAKETGSYLIEAVPIEIIRNTYYTSNNNKITHVGILYSGRLKDDKPVLENGIFTKQPQKYLKGKDRSIALIGQKILVTKILQPPVNEVVSYLNSKISRHFHKLFVKPISFIGSSYILQKETLNQIKPVDKTFLDVACGDDLTILKIQGKNRLVIANDISRDSLRKVSLKNKNKNIIFSNQNMLDMKFDKKFDVVIVKNVLHHLKNSDEMDYFLNNLKDIGNKYIVIDIIDPKLNIISKIWNRYYVSFLKDQGDFFLNYTQFKKIINLYFPNKKLNFSKIWTIKGPYMMAVIKP